MSNITYWYPFDLNGQITLSAQEIQEAAYSFEMAGVSNLVIGIDGRRLSDNWDYLNGFNSTIFETDLEGILGDLFGAGYTGTVDLMPINSKDSWREILEVTDANGNVIWTGYPQDDAVTTVEATLDFISGSAHGQQISGIVADAEFAQTTDWQNGTDADRADILRQYNDLLERMNTAVKTEDPNLKTISYHGAHVDDGTTGRYVLNGVDYGATETFGANVDTLIIPIRLTDLVDPEVNHDFDLLMSRVSAQIMDELGNASSTDIIVDLEWGEAENNTGRADFFSMVANELAAAITSDPEFAGVAVYKLPTQNTPYDINVSGEVLIGTDRDDQLAGGSGDDYLFGGDGWDGVTGGAGADTFVFNEGSLRDYVGDFQVGEDRVQLDGDLIAAGNDVFDYGYQSGTSTVFEFGQDVLVLINTDITALSINDFFIV
ncbi:MAG: hypothetical protein AAF737_01475 [Pseudomonadota bacterium]